MHAGTTTRPSGRSGRGFALLLLLASAAALPAAEAIEDYVARRKDVRDVEFRLAQVSDTIGIMKSEALVRILDATHYSIRTSSSSGVEVISGANRTYSEWPREEVLVVADGTTVATERTEYTKGAKEPVKYSVKSAPIAEGHTTPLPGGMDAASLNAMRTMMDIAFRRHDRLQERETAVFTGKLRADAAVPAMAAKYLGDLTMVFDRQTGLPLRFEMLGSGTGRKSVAAEMLAIKWKAELDPKQFVYVESRETEAAMNRRLAAAQPAP